MPLDVGTLTVRRWRQVDRRLSGLVRPQLFVGFPDDFVKEAPVGPGRRISELVNTHALVALGVRYQPRSANPDQVYADEYCKACRALGRTPAGARATELLYSMLTPDQRRTAERYGYFDVTIYDRARTEALRRLGRPLEFRAVTARIRRTFPNGNITLTGTRCDDVTAQVCLHPIAPYPIDDICLTQMMALVTDPDDFITKGNVHEGGVWKRFTRMFSEVEGGGPLILPSDLNLNQEAACPSL